jgi:hypothetical protein
MLFNRWDVDCQDCPLKPTFVVPTLRSIMDIL